MDGFIEAAPAQTLEEQAGEVSIDEDEENEEVKCRGEHGTTEKGPHRTQSGTRLVLNEHPTAGTELAHDRTARECRYMLEKQQNGCRPWNAPQN